MSLLPLLAINLAVLVGAVLLLWWISLRLRDVSIVDIFWGSGFVLIAWVTLLLSGGAPSFRAVVLVAMVTLWGLRLSIYLGWRNLGKPEDYRYAAMREHHGDRFAWVSMVTVFGLQGLLVWIIGLPVMIGASQAETWQAWRWIGAGLWLTGLLFESIGDYQLARFKANPANRGQVMNRGLWRYTRHPNYFGDFLVWWGIYLVAAEAGSWWWTILSPILMSFLLIRVSGVRLLETSLRSRISGYEEYVKSTSAFFPLPPSSSNG